MEEVQKIALFIDADNVSAKFGKLIMNCLEKRGEVFIRRIYGNWEKSHLHKWNEWTLTYGFHTVHQIDFSSGKNATDMTLAIDAMDVLYKHQATIFAIVSNDSDFTPLAVRLREHGVSVIGIGSKVSSVSFRNACNEFMLLDTVAEEVKIDVATDTVLAETTILSDATTKPLDAHAKIAELERKISLLEQQITTPKVSAYVRMTAEENRNSALQKSTGKISQRIIIKNLLPADSKPADAEKISDVENSAEVDAKTTPVEKSVADAQKNSDAKKVDAAQKPPQVAKTTVAAKVEPTPKEKVAAPKIVTTAQQKKAVATKSTATKAATTVTTQKTSDEKKSATKDKTVSVELKSTVPAQTSKPEEKKVPSPDDSKKAERERALNERFMQCGQNGMRNPKKKMQQIHDVLRETAKLHGDKDGFVPLTFVGQDLNKKKLGFTVKDFGYNSLNEFIGDFPDLYELTHTKPRSFRYRCI